MQNDGDHIRRLLERYPVLRDCAKEILDAYEVLAATYKGGGKVLLCGNGGSAADSEHIASELMKGFLRRRPIPPIHRRKLEEVAGQAGVEIASLLQVALPAIGLTTQNAINTAIINDTRADMAFAQQVYGLGKRGDALVGISTSGNSKNVVNAFYVAKMLGMKTVALTGRSGGVLANLADVVIKVPADSVTEIQELHLPVYHTLCLMLEAHFFPQ
ncbi:MAG: SIS domain-containing protein [Bacillota bacterium]